MTDFEPYPPPLEQLNGLGVEESQVPAVVDYRALGIEQKDVPALLQIIGDRRYDTAFMPAAWAPLHAWRALGDLRAVEAIEPMIALVDRAGDDDWILEDVPRALGSIGAPAIRALSRYVAERDRPFWSRIAAAEALTAVGRQHPEVRADCVAVLTEQLAQFATNDAEVNAFLIWDLLDLRAVESAPVIEAAFAADRVALDICGDWEDAQVELGLLPARLTPRPPYRSFSSQSQPPERPEPAPRPHATRERRSAEKRRRKLAKQSKRRNRRRR